MDYNKVYTVVFRNKPMNFQGKKSHLTTLSNGLQIATDIVFDKDLASLSSVCLFILVLCTIDNRYKFL